jgi:predicted regulator of Ras-like GTPase activity (Roadblock/LC7/MglB family)
MLQKLLGRLTPSQAPNSLQVKEALAQLVLASPDVVRATLVTSTGLLRGSFPQQAAQDRLSAMSAAMLSLGERICGELGSGEMRYVILAGSKTSQLLIVLSKGYALELELRPNVSVDAVLNAIKESTGPLLQALRIETPMP